MLGRFLLQVQMKTSLEVMNMNAIYEDRSHCILHIHFYRRIFVKIHYKTLKYVLKEFKTKVFCFKRNVNKCKQCSPFEVKHNTKI